MAFNKGEWAEAYTFVRLLGEGQIYAADENLNKIDERFYTIFKIFQDNIRTYYEIDSDNQKINIIDFEGNIIGSRDSIDFMEKADEFLEYIKEGEGSSFELSELSEFFNGLGIYKLKGSSNKKEDIKMEVLDLKLNRPKILNYTIKSFLGRAPTLFNASKDNTNFLFKIKGLSDEDMQELNHKKRKERFMKILEEYQNQTYQIEFIEKEDNKTLYQNLRLIDSNLPKIIAFILFYYFSHRRVTSISDLTNHLIEYNPLNLDDSEKDNFYKKKIIDFLLAVSFGLMPASRWNGHYENNGGMISVLSNGDILCHHIFYDNLSLKNYLFNHTKLDSPDAKISRNDYGYIFKENGEFFFKLNLQVRFKDRKN